MMNETAELTAAVPLGAPPASTHNEQGRTHGLSFIFWALEQNIWLLLSARTLVALLVGALSGMNWVAMVVAWLAVPQCFVILPLVYLVYLSHAHDGGAVDWRGVVRFRDEAEGRAWFGKKIPMEIL